MNCRLDTLSERRRYGSVCQVEPSTTKSLAFFFGLAWSGSLPLSLLEDGIGILGIVFMARLLGGLGARWECGLAFLLGSGALRMSSSGISKSSLS